MPQHFYAGCSPALESSRSKYSCVLTKVWLASLSLLLKASHLHLHWLQAPYRLRLPAQELQAKQAC